MNKVEIFERSLAQNDEQSKMPPLGFDDKNYINKIEGIMGTCLRINIRNGLDVTLFDYHFDQQSAELSTAPAGIELCVLFTGAGNTIALDPNNTDQEIGRIPNQSGKSYIVLTDDNYIGKTEIPANTDFKGIGIRFLPEFTSKLNNFPRFSELASDHRLHYCSAGKHWVSMFDTPEALYHLAKRIFDEGFSATPNDLTIEADVLNIMTEFINILQQPPQVCNSSKDKKLLQQAKEMMLKNLAHAWSIDEISRALGLNKQKLKQGFKVQFGIPVYGFLQQERLKAAHIMLEQGKQNVTEISLAIGYANPSHFAYLFKRQYGCSPSKIWASSLV
ncbi:MAG: AraC family transcriptional regulator [Hyphomicrobiales bacterium]